MVEPLVAVVRNSLFPACSVLQGTSPAAALVGGAMYYQQQPPFFSSNLFGPLPRQTKGKEREREEPRLRRVSQCKEWSCCTTRNFFYCPTHGIPFMLQELLPPRERPIRRFQNPKAYTVNRYGKYVSSRMKSLSSGQRRYASHATRPTQPLSQPRGQPRPSSSTPSEATRSPHSIYLTRFLQTRPKNYRLDDAWQAFNLFLSDEGGSRRAADHEEDHLILEFVERFGDKIELLYEEDNTFRELKTQRERFRKMVSWLEQRSHTSGILKRHILSIQHLAARCQIMYGQFKAVTETLEKIRGKEPKVDPLIAKTYTSLYSAIFYFRDALHVVDFLKNHFFNEYFSPPYCHHFRDKGANALVNRHPRLLYILGSLQDPVSLVKGQKVETRSQREWHQVVMLLILAYSQYKQPQLALLVYESALASYQGDALRVSLLRLRLVRVLAQGGYFDDANRLYSSVPTTSPEHMNTGMHLYALQGHFNTAGQPAVLDKHGRVMSLLSLAIQGKASRLRRLFNRIYSQDENGEYKGARPVVVDYAVAIYCHARCSDPEGMNYWLERMAKDDLKPNLHVYSSMIQSHLRDGNLDAVAAILDRMREAGVTSNAVIYTNIITALNRHHKPSTAEGIFKRALREKIMPDQAMIGALLNCYVEAGQWKEAIKLFKSLAENTRSPLKPTIEMYNIALKGHVIMGAPFRVVAMLFERLDADENLRPTSITFALLLQSACESGYMSAAMDVFHEMDQRAKEGARSLMNAFTFTILMAGFLRKGDKDKAMVVYQDMVNRGILPTSVTFNTVLTYYSNERAAESLQMAYEFMTRIATRQEETPIMEEGNLQLSPVQLVYEPLLRGYASNENAEGFEKLLGEMLDAGGEVTVSVLTYLLDLYRRKDRLEQATKVWNRLLELATEKIEAAKFPQEGKEDIEPSTDMLCVPLTMYLDALSRSEEHQQVLQTWQDYQRKGFSFNFFNWNRLGEYLVRAGEYERAFEVLDRIILPYIRVMRNEARTSSSSDPLDWESGDSEGDNMKGAETWRPPFDVLNNTSLSFLDTVITPVRPFSGSTRSRIIQDRSQRDKDDEAVTALALKPPPVSSSTSNPNSTPDSSDPPSSAPSSESEKDVHPLFTLPSSSDDPLTFENVPDFVRSLYALSFAPVGNNPRIHWSLLHHLLIGIQRLRAGQPAIQTSTPGQASHMDLYGADHSPEQQERVRRSLRNIFRKYPDAAKVVTEFDEQERLRLEDNYERVYIWS